MHVPRRQSGFPQRTRERGVVLLVALIFLVLITMLALVASSGTLLQQRMVSATRSAQLASMSGDTALRGAEWWLWSNPGACANSPAAINSTTGCVKYNPTAAAYASGGAVTQFQAGDNTWLNGIGVTYKGPTNAGFTSGNASADLAENPQYIIEDMGPVRPPTGGGPAESGQSGQNGSTFQPDYHTYRITARATGGDQNTVRVVQSTFDASAKH